VSMDFGTATTTAQLVASVVGTVKTARDLAKDIGNRELKETIGDAYDGLNDLRQRVLDLDEENRQLKADLAKKAEIEGPLPPFGYFIYKHLPENPLCPKCYQAKESTISYMGPPQNWNRGMRRQCRNCGHYIYEKEMDLTPTTVQSRRPYRSQWG